MTQLKLFLTIIMGYSFTFAQMNLPQGITGEISINDTSTLTNLKKQVQSLPIPEIIYPPNNATDIPIIPKFIIGTINQANRYEMELSLDQSFFNKISRPYWEFEESLSIDFLEWFPGIEKTDDFKNNTNYYWRVRALNTKTNETSSWSQTFKYKTKTSDESVNQPTLIYPESNSNIPWLDVNFQWDKVQTSNWYQVQWSTSSIFNGFTYHWSNMENLSYKTNIKPDAEYYCRVIAFNDNSVSQFSLKVNFNTGNFITLTNTEGTFDDGSSIDDYENSKDIYWLIQPQNANNIILNFSSFDTEEGYDYVTIYDGSTTSSPELGKFSGNELPPTKVSTSGSMLVRFKTDGAVTKSGWKANYSAYPIKIIIEGPYQSIPGKDNNLFYKNDFPIDADTLAIRIKLINNQAPQELFNINLESKLNGLPLKLHLNDGSVKLDSDSNGVIDKIPATHSKNYISILATSTNGFKGVNENLILETFINKINDEEVNINSADTISYYTSLQPIDGRTYKYFKDTYKFPNDQAKVSYEDAVLQSDHNSFFVIFYQLLWSLGGQCYGMSYTSGDYFLNPSNKPMPSDPFLWYPPSEEVLDKIITSQISQMSNSSFWKSILNLSNDFNIEYHKVLENMKVGRPSVLGMVSNSKGVDNHAVLITDLLTINKKAFFEVYDNNLPEGKYQAQYDISQKEFEYSSYRNFVIDEFHKIKKTSEEDNSFISSFIKYLTINSKKVFATFGKTNFLLTDSYGRRIGYLQNGSFINEIADSWVFRLPANDLVNDSVTVFYVSQSEDYEMKLYNYGNSKLKFENHSVNNSGRLITYWIDSLSLHQNSVCYYNEEDQSRSLLIDYNNDGTIDSTINTIETITDIGREEFNNIIPSDYSLSQNYPNPFNPSTKIDYSVPHISFVTLKVFDILGREVATLVNEEKSPGYYEINFNANNLSSGIYFYRLQAGEFSDTKKLILLK